MKRKKAITAYMFECGNSLCEGTLKSTEEVCQSSFVMA